MNKSKRIDRAALVIVIIGVVMTILLVVFSDKISELVGETGISEKYESTLFDTDKVMTVDILIDADQWQELLDTAIDETYYMCDVKINGTTYEDVGIRAKGNSSLQTIASSSDTDRYSFKIEFDHYIKGQTCDGLDKLVLNNNYSDATNMKEYIVYDMYQYLGVASSLDTYASISVNGAYLGVYNALESVEESFALRNFGANYGELYKPDNMELGNMGKGNMGNAAEDDTAAGDAAQGNTIPGNNVTGTIPDTGQSSDTSESAGGFTMPDMSSIYEYFNMGDKMDMNNGAAQGEGGMSSSGGGTDLNYIDDELDSYTDIWDSSVFDSGKNDHERVVKALKNICSGTNVEKYMDVESVLKYLAVHTFSVNLDSLSGTMTHNYYLYEEEGALSIVPWDYNMAFGGFASTDASSVVNFPIDTPFSSSISMEDRQFFSVLLENEEYLKLYHSYLQQLIDEYVYGGRFEEVYNRVRSQIDDLVASDPTAFYSYDEYDKAAAMLCDLVRLRADSIAGQLDGSIPSTTEGQQADSSALISASSIDLSVLGTMGGGNMGGGNMGGGNMGGRGQGEFNTGAAGNTTSPTTKTQTSATSSSLTSSSAASQSSASESTAGMPTMPGGGTMSGTGTPTAGMELPSDMSSLPSAGSSSATDSAAAAPTIPTQPGTGTDGAGLPTAGADSRNGQALPENTTDGILSNFSGIIILSASLLLMAAAFIFVKHFKKRR